MNYILSKDPSIRLDLMIDEQFAPQLVSYIERMGCKYVKEAVVKPVNGRIYRVLKDISGPNGAAVGELIGLFYSLEWGSRVEGEAARKFYMMVYPRRKEKKKHANKNRKKADQGSNGGDRGESSCDSGSGEVVGPVGDWDVVNVDCPDDLWESPRVE